MAAKRPPNRSGVFLGGVGGTIGKGGAGPDPAEVRQQFAKRREEAAKNRFKALKKEPSGFFERVAEDIGLEDFYERDVIPVMGKVFADTFKNAKETYGLSLVTPVALGARGVAAAVDKDEEFDEGFDYAAEAVRAGAGVIKTQGWEPAKKFVAPAVDKGTKIAKQGVDAFKDAVEKTDDYVEKEAPQYAIVKGWADRHAVEPAKDAVVEVISKVTDQPVNQRIDEADDMDRNFLYLSNDITQRGKERESAATPQQRERWMRMALGEYESPAWRGYKSPFSREQLAVMSDYELVNAAYGTHTNSIASFFEAAKNDLKKIAAMPAALNVLFEQITDADKRGDYRGLGNTAEFLARQIAGVFIAVNQATLYAATGGKLGDAEPLVRALKTEPILTSLDVAATASLYGKGATAALKTGGALSKAGAVAARVPGAPQVGGAIARGAEAAAAAPVIGRPLRIAAATGRGARRIADIERVEVRDPALRAIADVSGVEVGADRVFRPSSSFFSKSASLLRKKIYEGENAVSRAIYRRGEKADARAQRAIISAIVEQIGSEDAAETIAAFTKMWKESPDIAMRAMWDLQGPRSFSMPQGPLGGKTIDLTPGAYADELEDVLAGRLWVRRGDDATADVNDQFKFSDQSPGENWQNVIPHGTIAPPGVPVTKLTIDEVRNLETQIKVLRRLDDLPEEVVTRAREVLEEPYRKVFGERIGRKIGGKQASDEALQNILSAKELDRIAKITSLGVNVDPRVANLPLSVTERLQSQLGIGAPTGITRRAEGMAAVARLQDLTIARLMPLVPDEARAEVEKILGEAAETLEQQIATARFDLEKTVVSPEFRAEAEAELAEAEARLAGLQKYFDEKAQSTVVEKSEAEQTNFYDVQRQRWKAILGETFEGTVVYPPKIDDVQSPRPYVVPPKRVFKTKVKGPAGSNTAGVTGYWEGEDGVLRYVKQYDNIDQLISEFVANDFYQSLGIKVAPVSITFAPDHSLAIVTDIEAGVPLREIFDGDVSQAVKQKIAQQVVEGIVADAFLANWDVGGLNLDNILVRPTPDGYEVIRIDQGGALTTRAQGTPKTNSDLRNVDFNDFWEKNPSYKKILDIAGYKSIEDIPNLLSQVANIQNILDVLKIDSFKTYIRKLQIGASDKIDLLASNNRVTDDDITSFAPVKSALITSYAEFMGDYLDIRFDKIRDLISGSQPSKKPSELLKSGMKVLENYQMSGYVKINGWLRGKATGLTEEEITKLEKRTEALDALFDAAPATTEDMVLYRGRKGENVSDEERAALQEAGFIDIDKGYVSTSLSANFASGWAAGDKGIIYEILLPKGSKAVYGNAVLGMGKAPHANELEVVLPRGTAFKIVDFETTQSGRLVVKAVAITPGADDIADFPAFGQFLDTVRQKTFTKAKNVVKQKQAIIESFATEEDVAKAKETVSAMEAEYEVILNAQRNIDFVLESLMRDALEASDTPTGATVFIPTLGGPKGAKKTIVPGEALSGRGRPRDLKDIYTGQFAMLGSLEDIEQFSGALARNMRIPLVAYEAVTRLSDYLMRTGTVVRFSDDPEEFANQVETLSDAGLVYGNGEIGQDYVVLPINDRTGFFDNDTFKRLETAETEEIATAGRSDVGLDDAETSILIQRALNANAIDNLQSIPPGSTVVVVSKGRLDALDKELRAAAQAPGMLRRLTRLWVRITLTTLPRTPIANVVGSAFLSMLGNGLGGYGEALRLMRFSNAPPELLNKGLAGSFDEGGDLVVAPQRKRFRFAQRYMNYMYYYNVMGEDLARLSVFAQAAKKGIKRADLVKQIDDELLEASELNDAFQTLLEAVARGEFANGKPLTPELIRIRDDALQKADDFLGGARGLTSQQRMITTFIPFWQWYKHIFKLYFYTLPAKYPGRSLTLNAMARYGAEESARQGYYDSFYEDGIKIGEEVRGPNIYSKALSTNIFPFTFAGVLEAEEGAPGASFLASNIAPVVTTPLRIAGFGIPGQPLLTPEGQRLRGDFFSADTGEVALSEAERLIAPIGLLQRYLTPRGSLLLGAGRLATGRDIPQAQPQGEGLSYAVTPRGFAGLGMQALPELAARAFGGTIERIPVEGPVARRRLKDLEERERQRVLERYKEQRREQRENR